MNGLSVNINNLLELENFQNKISAEMSVPAVFFLQGDLGAGKTFFVKKFLSKFGVPESKVCSPTFNLIQTYQATNLMIFHLDLYRIDQDSLIIAQELQEIFDQKQALVFIEWAENISYQKFDFTNWQIFNLKFSFDGQTRLVTYQIQ
jgi:tRNA threonylcarbamoyladenosine biosynthesis protein TsaE